MQAIKRFTRKDKDVLAEMVLNLYQIDPQRLREALPEAAEHLDRLLAPPPERRVNDSPFGLTEREREFRLNSLDSILEKAAGSEAVSKEQAVKALEDAAALREHAWDSREAVMGLARSVFDLPVAPEKSLSIPLLKGKPVHHTYELIRGVNLSLTWDGKLIRIDLNAQELRIRQKGLSFVGIGSDTKSDVAENHDAYLDEIYGEKLSRRRKE